jgi:hypothetical protein
MLMALLVYQEDEAEGIEGRIFDCKTWVRDALGERGIYGLALY